MRNIYTYELVALSGVGISLATINQILQTCILAVSLATSIYGAYLLAKNKNKNKKQN